MGCSWRGSDILLCDLVGSKPWLLARVWHHRSGSCCYNQLESENKQLMQCAEACSLPAARLSAALLLVLQLQSLKVKGE
jgi:hypothetical protein